MDSKNLERAAEVHEQVGRIKGLLEFTTSEKKRIDNYCWSDALGRMAYAMKTDDEFKLLKDFLRELRRMYGIEIENF